MPMQAGSVGQVSEAAQEETAPRFWAISDWLFSLSLANICFLRTWAVLLERGRNIVPSAYLMAIVNVLAIGACIRIGYFLVQRRRSRLIGYLGVYVFAALIVLPFHALSTIYFSDDVPKRNITYAVAFCVAAAMIVSRRARGGMKKLFLGLAPFVFVTFGQSMWRISAYDAAWWEPPKLPVAEKARTPRLLWILFDEWDYGITFGPKRPPLPELDRVVSESFHALNAHPPGKNTTESVPRLVSSDITATVQNIKTKSTVFSRARSDGLRTATIAWFINYCELFSSSLDACWTTASDAERSSMGTTALEIAGNQVRNLFENQFRSPLGQPLGAKRHALDYKFIRKAAVEAASNPGFDFVYVHFPIPHEPLFYDAGRRQFDLNEKPILSFFQRDFRWYLDAVQLVDLTIGELRRAMEAKGLWKDTHLLITSDHPYRRRAALDSNRNDDRVPFIVRLAGSSGHIASKHHFNTLLAANLATALLRGEIRAANDLQSWMAQNMANGTDVAFSRSPSSRLRKFDE